MSTFRNMAEADLPQVMSIIAQAQAYLASQGVDQWQDGYPDEATMRQDIADQTGYVLEDGGRVVAIATIIFTGEPTYDVIHDGAWTTPEPYACIHRIAVDASQRGKGTANEMMAASDQRVLAEGMHSIRIDTHEDNLPMQRMLMRNGYTLCGVIYLDRGAEMGAKRVALEKSLP